MLGFSRVPQPLHAQVWWGLDSDCRISGVKQVPLSRLRASPKQALQGGVSVLGMDAWKPNEHHRFLAVLSVMSGFLCILLWPTWITEVPDFKLLVTSSVSKTANRNHVVLTPSEV